MIAENTIQITNVNDLSVAYLTRFFSKAGDIQKIIKNQEKRVVFIEFKNKKCLQKAFAFNGRVLDKKPISIKRLNQIIPIKQKQTQLKEKGKIGSQKLILFKLPSFHELNKQDLKPRKRSSYRQISEVQIEQPFPILLDTNPFENIKNKSQLWKTILFDMKKCMTKNDNSQNELILSISMGVWAFIQLKLVQIEYLLAHKQNMKSKYVENFIQEMVSNKLSLLTNDNLITNSNRYKVHQQHQGLLFGFNVTYPEQTEQEAQFFCQANQAVHKFLIAVYQHSHRLGKICHVLHTNSLIIYEDRKLLQNMIKKFRSKPSQILLGQSLSKKNIETNQQQQILPNQQRIVEDDKSQSLSSFTGQIQHYGSCVFQNLTHNQMNSMVWIQNVPTRIQTEDDFPGFFTISYIFDKCKGKSSNQSNFFNLYRFDQKQSNLLKQESFTFADQVLVFEQGQFSVLDLVQNSLGFIRFKMRKLIAEKQQGKLKRCKVQKYLFNNQFHSSTSIHSQTQIKQEGIKMVNQNESLIKKLKISVNLDIFFVGIHLLEKSQQIKKSFNCLKECCKKLQNMFNEIFQEFQVQIKFNMVFIDMIPSKQSEFNAFKCENYLINHIDTHIIGKNTIIASEQFAQKVAQKVLQNADKNELFGFKDKKYIGSEIWRLYNKSGARRAKLKISQYHFKKLKSQ